MITIVVTTMMATSGAGTDVVMRGTTRTMAIVSANKRIDQPGNVEDVRHLRGEDQNAERVDEADHHRARDEARQPRQAGKAERDLDHAGEDDGRQDVADPMQPSPSDRSPAQSNRPPR